jgi:hypothetical protein
MYARLTKEQWKGCLESAALSGNVNKLKAWRYGMQAGLSDAIKKGIKDEKLDFWVIKRCRDLEKMMRYILKQKYPMPGDKVIPKILTGHKNNMGKRKDYSMSAIEAKRRRDLELEKYLKDSSF